MPVHGHGPRADPTARVIAHQPSVIIAACVRANGMFELRDERDGGEGFAAVGLRADDARRGDAGDAGGEAFEGEGVPAEAAGEGEAGAGFEADGVWDLGLQWKDLGALIGGCAAAAVGDGVLARVEAEAFGESDGGGAGHGSAESFDGREDLLEEVPFYVGLEG